MAASHPHDGQHSPYAWHPLLDAHHTHHRAYRRRSVGRDDYVELRSFPGHVPGRQHRTDRRVHDGDSFGKRRAWRALYASHRPRDGLAGKFMRAVNSRFVNSATLMMLAALVVGTALGPMLWAVSTSLKNEVNAVSAIPSLIPSPATFSNYLGVFTHKQFLIGCVNSILCGAGAVVIALAVGIPAGYAASRYTFPAKRPVMLLILATSMVPGAALLAPTL